MDSDLSLAKTYSHELQIQSATDLDEQLQLAGPSLTVLMCKARACRPCKVRTPMHTLLYASDAHISSAISVA